jgi:heat-inducible transcriptional repressor
LSGELSNREKTILRYIVEDFIKTANPVGSRYISKNTDINLSPATIRNVMSDLEGMNFITHQHTSGGRMPTDKGYRYFVNELMDFEPLKSSEMDLLKSQINDAEPGSDDIYKEVSKILGKLTKEISIVSQPYLSEGIFEKLELITLSSIKLLVVVSIKSGLVRTLIFDLDTSLTREKLERVTSILNEKLGGLSLKEIRNSFRDRFRDIGEEAGDVVKIFIDSIDRIFHDEKEGMTLYLGGTTDILSQPEFDDRENYKNLIELTDDKNIVVHVLNTLSQEDTGIAISIGSENSYLKLMDYSIVCKNYIAGEVKGKIALIGPRRMNYSKMVSMLNFTSQVITGKL